MRNYIIKNSFFLISLFVIILSIFGYELNAQGAILEGAVNKLIEADLPFTKPNLIKKWDSYYVIVKFPVTPGQKYTLDVNYPSKKDKGRALIIYGADPLIIGKENGPASGKYGYFIETFSSGFMWPCNPPPGCWLTRRYNIYISPKSSGRLLYVIIKSETPGLKNSILLRYPALSDSIVRSKAVYPLCPPRGKYYCGKYGIKFDFGTIIKDFLLWGSPTQPTKKQIYSSTHSQTVINVEGKWEYDVRGEKRFLDLKQSGNNVYGFLHYPEGVAMVNGEIKGDEVILTVTYNDPNLIARWIPRKTAKQAVGIKSIFKLTPSSDPGKMEGLFYSWHVYWDSNKDLTKKYDALQSGNPSNDKPSRYILVRKESSLYSSHHEQLTGITIEAEDELSANVISTKGSWQWRSRELSNLPHSGKGYWYLSRGGDWLLYVFNVPSDGTYKLWVKDLNDRKHPHEARTILVNIDSGREFRVPANTSPGSYGWGWHLIGTVYLTKGKHIMKVVKESTTSAAAVLDAFYVTQGEEQPTM